MIVPSFRLLVPYASAGRDPRPRAALWFGVAASALLTISPPANAETKPSQSSKATSAARTPAPARASAPDGPSGVERITVRRQSDQATGAQPGGGLIRPQTGTRAVSTVGRDFMDRQPPMATAYQLAAMLPGANVATSDPFGFSPSTNITVRGLSNDSLGYGLAGMPRNDVAYYNG